MTTKAVNTLPMPSSQFMPRSCNDLILTHISPTVCGKCTNNLLFCLQLRRGGKHGVCTCVCVSKETGVGATTPLPPEVPQPCTRAGCGNPPSMNASACALDAAAPTPFAAERCLDCFYPSDGGSSYQMEFLILCCRALASVPGSPGTRAGRATPGLGALRGNC